MRAATSAAVAFGLAGDETTEGSMSVRGAREAAAAAGIELADGVVAATAADDDDDDEEDVEEDAATSLALLSIPRRRASRSM